MSTNYLILKPKISFGQLRRDIQSNNVLGLSHSQSEQEKPDSFCITDGTSFLWVTGENYDYCLDRFGYQGTTDKIIEYLEAYIQCQDVIGEHDKDYDEWLED